MRSFVAAALLFVPALAGADEKAKPKLLVPAYFYPSGDGMKAWETLLASADKASIVAIVNPDSGPGKRVDANYAKVFEKAAKSKATLVGYVTLSYARRPIADVKSDIDRWLKFYPGIRGIFFDEQPSDVKQAASALDAFAHARSKVKDSLVISNPGTTCDPAYLGDKGADAACLFEGPGGFNKYQATDWLAKAGLSKLALLTYDVKLEWKTAMQFADKQKAGYVYVTDAKGPNPWDRLPSNWTEIVKTAGK